MEKLIKKLRRDLHQIPELDFDLFETNKYIIKFLKNLNFELFQTAKTGVLTFKKGLKNTTIAFRADMDALSIKEENDTLIPNVVSTIYEDAGHSILIDEPNKLINDIIKFIE